MSANKELDAIQRARKAKNMPPATRDGFIAITYESEKNVTWLTGPYPTRKDAQLQTRSFVGVVTILPVTYAIEK